jgi:uncharacterized protein
VEIRASSGAKPAFLIASNPAQSVGERTCQAAVLNLADASTAPASKSKQNPNMPIDTPLTEAEFDRLADFLADEYSPSACMDISMLDGYLAAVVSGPNLVMADQMLRWIWDTENGEDSPEFQHKMEASEIIGLILRHYQHVNSALNDGVYLPRMAKRDIDGWCAGYYVAIAADMAGWTPLLVSQPKLLSAILLHGTTDGEEVLKSKTLTDMERDATVDSLTESSRQIHAYWLEQRRQGLNRGETPGIMPSRGPVRAPVKVGRNEPCPCGSGKKYKHCHGGSGGGAPENDKQWLH